MRLEITLLTLLLFSTCNRMKSTESTVIGDVQADTIVKSGTVPNEIVSTGYREKEYFVVAGKDTSNLSCIFSENKNSGKISLTFKCNTNNKRALISSNSLSDSAVIGETSTEPKVPYYKTTYQQQMSALGMILKKSSEDFDLSKLQNISLELLSSGNLAIEVTDQYVKRFGTKSLTTRYKEVEQILSDSQLYSDINEMLKSYFIVADRISVEKVYFAGKKAFLAESKIDTVTTKIPDYVLDCFIYINLKAKDR